MKINIIAHGGNSIGMGHIMRTFSLAEEFRKQKDNVSFISKYEQGINFINSNGYDVYPIKVNNEVLLDDFYYGCTNDLKNEEIQIKKLIIEQKPDVIIIDSYIVNMNFFTNLSKHTKCIVYIDDLNMFTYPVNILINGTISAEFLKYKKGLTNEIMLLGLNYNLVRSEFRDLPIRTVNHYVKDIMITVGGADPYNMTGKLVDYVSQEDEFINRIFHIVVTKEFSSKNKLIELSKKYNNIIIYENPLKMSDIMLISDLAISAGGSTIYELASCGVPIIAFCYAENQKLQVELMEDLKLVKYLGFYNELKFERFILTYNNLIHNYDERAKAATLGQTLLDGNGAERVVLSIKDYLEIKNN